jgi:hypothetical protein
MDRTHRAYFTIAQASSAANLVLYLGNVDHNPTMKCNLAHGLAC